MVKPLLTIKYMTSDMKRITFLVPEDTYNQLVKASDQRAESMSNIVRRLVMEWLEEQAKPHPKPAAGQGDVMG